MSFRLSRQPVRPFFHPDVAFKLGNSHVPWGRCVVALLLLAGVGGCKRHGGAAIPPQPVMVSVVQQQAVPVDIALPGRTDAYEQAMIRPQVSGVVTAMTFQQGGDVHKGQQLYQIYPVPYQAALKEAQGQLIKAQAAARQADLLLARYGRLLGPHAVSTQEYDNALASAREAHGALEAAQGQVTSAQVNLNYSHVSSPIDGRIGRTIYTVGTLVTAGQQDAIAVVTRLDPIYVDVNLPADEMLRLRADWASGKLERKNGGAAVRLQFGNGLPYDQVGTVALSEVTVSPGTGTQVVRAVMPNPQKLLLPGMYVVAHMREGVNAHALLVPQVAVERTPKGDAYVMVATPDTTKEGQLHHRGKVAMQMVKLGNAIGDSWVVEAGLQPGDLVVTEGLQKIQPGKAVTIMPHPVAKPAVPPAAPVPANQSVQAPNPTPDLGAHHAHTHAKAPARKHIQKSAGRKP
ncbi:efflux RND transporter periplasmic adaptor subunit [Formicincola oecophyllae]|uniref:Efflux RND transporter periplasmic adaptor subunit n=1 Tax=Formicincola oecophyllae TaxID=2558361 RepID=A0A4Y6U8F1_9PROT|nr:efflux RND transporter periplasmic adaptor subunit [Formicincola oecophyllae]QDH13464.1 efflux RND transporter periplasmic adaptor subunit [Formicincola oecophyllae]